MKESSCDEDHRKRIGVKTYSSYKQENERNTNCYMTNEKNSERACYTTK